MTVQNIVPYGKYVTSGSDSVYTVSYYVEDKDNLLIKLNDEVVSKNEYNYIKSSNAIQFNTTLLANQKLEIFRKTKLERATNFESYNNTLRPEVLNKDLDRIWLNLQEQSHKVDQYDLNYDYAVHTSTQALTEVVAAQTRADDAYELADITNTETRPISRGGTGANDAATARSNLEIYSQIETSNLLNTKLTAVNNLTDVPNIATARTNLNVHSKEEVISLIQTGGSETVVAIEGGGTGSGNTEGARENLGVYSKVEVDNNYLKKTENGAIEGELSVLSLYSYGDITAFSDNRIKDNVENIENALSKVNKINGVTYTRNDLENKNNRHVGLIAQEVLTVCPEAVRKINDERGTLTVNYQGLIGLLVEAIKELDKKVKALGGK